LTLLHPPASKTTNPSETKIKITEITETEEKKFLTQIRSRFQTRCCIFYYPSPSVRKPLTADMSRWLRTQEFNGGFQPTDVPAIFLFRKEGVQEVASHEICHFLVDSGYLPGLVSAAEMVQARLEASDLLCRGTGSVLRAEEGFIELLSNCLSIDGAVLSAADMVTVGNREFALRNLLRFLLRQCSYLQKAKDWRQWQCLVQKSCIFSYFFLRTALLLDLISSSSSSSRRPQKLNLIAENLVSRYRGLLQDDTRIQKAAERAIRLLVSPSSLDRILSQRKWEAVARKETGTGTGVMTPDVDTLLRTQRAQKEAELRK